jgi:glutamate dehydrogenase/leucine dehydrogenase
VSSLEGLDVNALIALKNAGKAVTECESDDKADAAAIIDIPCEIWIPAARPDVLTKANAGRLKASIVAQGANIPCTPEAEAMLESRGVLILPDFVANAGGVICACTEYHGGNESAAFGAIDEKIRRNTAAMIEESRRAGISTRAAAMQLAGGRIRSAARARRWR